MLFSWLLQNTGMWPLTPNYVNPPSYQFWERLGAGGGGGGGQDRAVETCRLPFTFTEECWQFLALLSVGGQDKSSVFINKIDSIAYHQFLFCVFPYRLYSAEHLLWLRSFPLCPSPGTLRCFNIFFHIGLQNPTPQQMRCCSTQIHGYSWNTVVLKEDNNEKSLRIQCKRIGAWKHEICPALDHTRT